MKTKLKSIAIGAALFTLGDLGCGGGDDPGPLDTIDSLIVLQRPRRNDTGDIFDYQSYVAGAKLVTLSPPTADGQLTTICCDQDPDFAKADISGYDLSFDAKTIVFSAKLDGNSSYGLFLLQLSDGTITQLATDPQRDYVAPIFLPGNRIMFTSNEMVNEGQKQHRDEYERRTAIQLGRINVDGTGLEMGPLNLSHRTAPSLASDGRVVFTQWDHLGNENSGHLMFVNQDMQELREGFGKEGKGASNSTLKAREISPGRFVAVATARNRTLNAGALIDIRLGTVVKKDGVVTAAENQSEANSTFRQLTPDVPMGNEPSSDTVGRYYDAYPLNAKDKPDLIVSWANGPVESGYLQMAGETADFGIYLLDSNKQLRRPILDDHTMWDVQAMPLRTRTAPNIVESAQDPKLGGATLVGSLNVYNSSLKDFAPGSVYGVRVMEGFSSEEGFREDFGTPRFEGHANLGVARVAGDGSWAAKIPANIPVHLQAVDNFGMSLFSEPVWFSGRAGEARICGGCHENRTQTTNVQPGQLDAISLGAANLMSNVAKDARKFEGTPAAVTDIVGVGWSTQVQPILTNHCVECHDGTKGAANPSYTITDPKTGTSSEWVFNLKGDALTGAFALAADGETYSASYFSLVGPDMEAVEKGKLMITGDYKIYMKPTNAHGSLLFEKLNPFQIFPSVDTSKLAFPGMGQHLIEKGRANLSAVEMYTLILAADMGASFYARENNPHANQY